MSIDQFLLSADTTDLNYPKIRPTLDLNFARTKTLDPRITFTRASGGSYVGADGLIKYAGVNEARFDHDPVTGESLGLLIEEARTNLLSWSETFTFGPWFYTSSSSINLNSTISPSGGNNSAKWVFDDQTAQRILGFNRTVSTNTNHTFSIFLKSAGLNYISIYYGKSGSPFTRIGIRVNLTNGTFTNTNIGNPTSVSIRKVDDYGNGWYRVQIGGIFDTTSTDGYVELRTRDNANTTEVITGDGVFGYHIWGAQLEQGSFPTSYIPTQGSTRTRAADNVSITGKNFSSWHKQNEGTVYTDIKVNGVQTGRFDRLWVLTNSNLNADGNGVYISGVSGPGGRYDVISTINNISQYSGSLLNSNITATNTPRLKSAFGFNIGDSNISYNGRFANNTGVTITDFADYDRLLIGQPHRFQGYSCMTVSQLTYYPKRLPNQQLQSLTS